MPRAIDGEDYLIVHKLLVVRVEDNKVCSENRQPIVKPVYWVELIQYCLGLEGVLIIYHQLIAAKTIVSGFRISALSVVEHKIILAFLNERVCLQTTVGER